MVPKKNDRWKHSPLVWFVVCTFASCARAYPNGVPSSTCVSMMPQHGVGPQETGSPYTLLVNGSTYQYGGMVTVYIQSSEKYRGILLQARSSNTSAIIGSWTKSPAQFKTVNCGSTSSALTHNSGQDKDSGGSVFTWVPPKTGAPQVLEFWATVLKDEYTFWTGIKSSMLRLDESVPPSNKPAVGWGMHLSGDVIIIIVSVSVWMSWCV